MKTKSNFDAKRSSTWPADPDAGPNAGVRALAVSSSESTEGTHLGLRRSRRAAARFIPFGIQTAALLRSAPQKANGGE